MKDPRWAPLRMKGAGALGWVTVIASLGLATRVGLVLAGGGVPRFYDERDYDAVAMSLLEGHGFAIGETATAFRAPGQPLFLALVYGVVGHRPLLAELLQALLLVPLPFIAVRLARLTSGQARETVSLREAVFAALVAFHPGLAYASASLYPVSLTAIALMVGVWLSAEAIERGGLRRAALAATALGVAGACVTYLAPLAAIVATFSALRRRFAVAATIAAIGLMPAVAWTARNAGTMGTPSLSTNGGFNLALGANDEATPRSGNWVEPDLHGAERPSSELARDKLYREVAVGWIRQHPLRWAGLAAGRGLAALDSVGKPRTAGAQMGGAATMAGWLLAPVVALGLVGLARSRRSVVAWITAAALALIVASSALTIAKPRFRFPADPLLWVFAAIAAEQGVAHALSRRRSRREDSADADVAGQAVARAVLP
jgi:hypothetical protein